MCGNMFAPQIGRMDRHIAQLDIGKHGIGTVISEKSDNMETQQGKVSRSFQI